MTTPYSLTLIKNAELYTPYKQGKRDVLFCGNQIIAIEDRIDQVPSNNLQIIDAAGQILVPGFVDALVHISGGGGEGGFATRTPEMNLTDATLAGVTTVVAALGTDDVTRSLEDMLAKAYGLEAEGISAFCHTGSYQVPVQTITGSIRKDLITIPSIIGVGELAISDHRGSHPSVEELTRIAADSRVGGLLSGKKGTVFLHLGDHEEKLNLINQVIESSAIPASQFYATHINRMAELLEDGARFAACGGFIDMTTSTTQEFIAQGEIPASQAVVDAIEMGAPLSQISMSSDGNASLPAFDDDGNLTGLEVGQVGSLLTSFVELAHLLDLESALKTVTSNPSIALGLKQKGQIGIDFDCDFVLLNKDLSVSDVWAKGQHMVKDGIALVKGTFQS
jgi:beta-aspartyl-dipeptidase (metallo-type)